MRLQPTMFWKTPIEGLGTFSCGTCCSV